MFSSAIPSGNFQSNECTNEPRKYSTITTPILVPAHILRPAPNGISSKSFPRGSIFAFFPLMNLSGSNSRGFSQTSGSLPIAHMFTLSLVFLGT
ncbi:hypothetical protein RHMOL_Rhmol04G0338800 [Rhododendron molle]|uniref:Uncharacterized protein n=1 Tax=Rhododendron molle TaxID=49168 RepID=A0ACC0P6X7_RHOML|nr:hypothetical protein RHMOL_Rhmol04G0338800 [Rhododendron molle]